MLVFDEIDANVGGRLGSVIGSKLRKLAAHHQVLCITHLPQIASYADRHLTVRKEVAGETDANDRPHDGRRRAARRTRGDDRRPTHHRHDPCQAKELIDAATAELLPQPSVAARAGKNGKKVKA